MYFIFLWLILQHQKGNRENLGVKGWHYLVLTDISTWCKKQACRSAGTVLTLAVVAVTTKGHSLFPLLVALVAIVSFNESITRGSTNQNRNEYEPFHNFWHQADNRNQRQKWHSIHTLTQLHIQNYRHSNVPQKLIQKWGNRGTHTGPKNQTHCTHCKVQFILRESKECKVFHPTEI